MLSLRPSLCWILILLPFIFRDVVSLSSPSGTGTALVTGANGYIGRAVVQALLKDTNESIICLVRSQRVNSEQAFWRNDRVQVLPYDMLDGGTSLEAAMETCRTAHKTIYHIASVFGPTVNHLQTALDNVQGTEDLVRTMAHHDNCRLVLTSSMAAVRGTGQEPLNGQFYTHQDWNTKSKLGANWGSSYQWSKMESERRAWDVCNELGIPMSALCPSFVFGPPMDRSGSFSLTLVGEWVRGISPVQSRLFVDVRDIAKAHVEAGRRPEAVGQRFIVSTEERIPSESIAQWLKESCEQTGLSDPAKIHYDANFDGGAIPIGAKEVEATERMKQRLGITLHKPDKTIKDMGRSLLEEIPAKPINS